MDFLLQPAEVRVLGALLEKDITTPEYYPLTREAYMRLPRVQGDLAPSEVDQ